VWPAIIAAVLCLSLNDATTVLLAGSGPDRSEVPAKEIVSSSFMLHFGLGLFSAAACVALIPVLLGERRAEIAGPAAAYGACFSVLTMLAMFQRGVLVGQRRVHPVNVLRVAQPLFWLASLAVLAVGSALTWATAAFASVFALAASVSLGLLFLRPGHLAFSLTAAVQLVRRGARFQSANMALYLAAEADKVIIIAILGNTEVGIYLVAQSISGLIFGLVSQTLSVRVLSDVAGAEAAVRGEKVRLYFNAASMVAVILGLGVVVCAPVIPIIYGDAFSSAVTIAQVLAVGFVFKAARSPIDQGLRASGLFFPSIVAELSTLAFLVVGVIVSGSSISILIFSYLFCVSQFVALLIASYAAARNYRMNTLYWIGVSDGQLLRIISSAIASIKVAIRL
jgi:O-antigen/teichoic acid export membrane protein